jgi:hypothetical protein
MTWNDQRREQGVIDSNRVPLKILPIRFMNQILAIGLLSAAALRLGAGSATITVQADKPGHPVSPLLCGIFFEDINLSAGGGICPELVRNRSFADADQPERWRLVAETDSKSRLAIDSSRPLNPLNRRCLRIEIDGPARVVNDGYWGMNIVKGEGYTFKLAARAADGFSGPMAVKLLGAGKELAGGEINGVTAD